VKKSYVNGRSPAVPRQILAHGLESDGLRIFDPEDLRRAWWTGRSRQITVFC